MITLSIAEQEQLEEDIARWRWDPVAFVLENFAPGWEEAHPGEEFKLEKWHIRALRALCGKKRRILARASMGVGKTFYLAMAAYWFETTRQHPNASATSITRENLEDNLWKELAVWQRFSPLMLALFEITSTSFTSRHHPRDWWLSPRAFPKDANKEQITASLAGLHAPSVLRLLDEIGTMPMAVIDTCEGIFAEKTDDALMVCAGNCNDEDGPVGVISNQRQDQWEVIQINGDPDNPDRCTRVNLEEAKAAIARDGRDDPMVRVKYLGLFPLRGSNKLLGSDEVSAAMERDSARRNWETAPIIYGLDTAEEGDDSNRLAKRQGCMSWMRPEWQWKRLEPEPLADRIGSILAEAAKNGEEHDALFVDITGGWGQGVRLRLRDLGVRNVIGVDFGAEALDPSFHNKRAEMYFLLAEWIVSVGCLPRLPKLRAELTAIGKKIGQKGGRSTRMLEPKVDIKARLGRSPDDSDAMALTFAAPVFRQSRTAAREQSQRASEEKFSKNPYAWMAGKR